MGEMNLPWRVVISDVWPFHIRVLDSEARDVLHEKRYAYGSKQNTLEDVMSGRFLGADKDVAVRENAAQMARIEAIVRAVNRDALFDEMVEALERCERTLGEVAKIIKPMANEAALVSARAVLSKVREASK